MCQRKKADAAFVEDGEFRVGLAGFCEEGEGGAEEVAVPIFQAAPDAGVVVEVLGEFGEQDAGGVERLVLQDDGFNFEVAGGTEDLAADVLGDVGKVFVATAVEAFRAVGAEDFLDELAHGFWARRLSKRVEQFAYEG